VKSEVDVTDFSYLGMRVRMGDGVAELTMDGYEDDMLSDLVHLPPCATPALRNLFEIGDTPPLSRDDRIWFHTTTAKLLYYALRVKPGALVAVSYLTTRVREPNEGDKMKLKRVLGYVKHTKGKGIKLGTGDITKLVAYVDASFGCHDDAKSHTGSCVKVGDGTVYARSTKQKIMTKDSTEAEIVGASDEVRKVICCNDFMIGQGQAMDTPVLMQDNKSAIRMMCTGVGKDRSKHLRVRKFLVKSLWEEGALGVDYTPTGMMCADLLAKPSQGALYRAHNDSLCANLDANVPNVVPSDEDSDEDVL
jgi:hypothetical protein